MNKALLIVDPQYDFINGSLPVSGAVEAMDALAEYVSAHDGDYSLKIVTVDWHPADHMSFVDNGGIWPRHCVAFSHGASIWQPLIDALYGSRGVTLILTKGTGKDTEEYSVFQNEASKAKLVEALKTNSIECIDICGIAGDVCVLNTLKDGINVYSADAFRVLEQYAPSLDGGSALNSLIEDCNLIKHINDL